jgi:DNA-binding transcriptional ArsR family regulator
MEVLAVNRRHLTVAHHLLGSRTRVRLLRVLIFAGGERLWVRELFRRTGVGASSVQRELEWLRGIGMVQMNRLGGAAYYEVIEGHPLLGGLRQLLESAELLDGAGGHWSEPPAEARQRNRTRRLEHHELQRGSLNEEALGPSVDTRTEPPSERSV